MSARITTSEECPVCGATVPPGAKACPGCGADERSGWDEDATRYDDLDLPGSAFTEDDPPPRRRNFFGSAAGIIAAAVLLVLLVLSLVMH
jgi:hypothetical protein